MRKRLVTKKQKLRKEHKFFTMREAKGAHRNQFGQVFSETSIHFSPGWICVGFVSQQTPLGQGTYLGFNRNELRRATKREMGLALKRNHPHGENYRPSA